VTLCIDVGNTRTKVARVEDGRVLARADTATLGDGYRARVDASIANVLADGRGAAPLRAVISSVVPAATDPVLAAAAAHAEESPLRVTADLLLDMSVAVTMPEYVGADRLCTAVGALIRSVKGNAIVVDVGSAVTVDLVVGRRFLGGAIMPGPRMMLDAMASGSGQLPRVELDGLSTLFPVAFDITESAMTLGAGLACAGGILEAVHHFSAHAPKATVHLTGGGLRWVDDRLPVGWRRDPDLCFLGLARIAQFNPPPK
jgi:type III pantothenate kinase